ncbi:hypothetical protein [Nocardiopsis sp. CC223A]|nr:hypothetical protein [Nocardiopsis sp. CC223A]
MTEAYEAISLRLGARLKSVRVGLENRQVVGHRSAARSETSPAIAA